MLRPPLSYYAIYCIYGKCFLRFFLTHLTQALKTASTHSEPLFFWVRSFFSPLPALTHSPPKTINKKTKNTPHEYTPKRARRPPAWEP